MPLLLLSDADIAAPTAQPSWQREWCWLSLALALLAAWASWGHWTWRLDQTVHDAAQATWTHPAPEDVVIVAIDDASLEAVGRWPWRRAIHAQVISALSEARPRSILYNLLMTEPDNDPQQDRLMAEALRRSGRVVLPVGHAVDTLGQGHELLPLPAFRDASTLAHADVTLDVDGVLRHAWLHAGTPAQAYPHPALALLQVGAAAGATPPASRPVAPPAPLTSTGSPTETGWQRTDRVAIRYLGPPGRIHQVSVAALLRGEVPASTFTGRDVLVGVTARGLADTFLTPVTSQSTGMAGVEVSGQLLANLRAGGMLHTVPRPAQAATSALLVLLLGWSFRTVTPRKAMAHALLLSGAALTASWLLMAADIWWAPFSTVLVCLLAYPVWSWRRLEATARALQEELDLIARDTAAENGQVPDAPRGDMLDQRTAALRQAGAQLRVARQLLADTLAALPDAVFVLDAQGRVNQANRQAALMSGQASPTALNGRTLPEALAHLVPTEAPSWDLLLKRVASGSAEGENRGASNASDTASTPHTLPSVTTEASHASGRQYLVHLVPMQGPSAHEDDGWPDWPTDARGVIVCATDLTELRRAEMQRQELLGFIAHDIRSPQASLLALVELQQMGHGPSPDEALQHIESLARGTLDLCEELLQVMRAENRPVSLKTTDLHSLADECIDEVSLRAQLKHVTLAREWDGEIRHPALVDDYLVHRALVNLLGNAVKFSPEHSEVTVSVSTRDGHHIIAVTDQGPGIPQSELGRLFRRYERLEQGRASHLPPGIGLGLVFIDTVARRHGGRVTVDSQPGQGARFELWLPDAPYRPGATV